MPCEDCKGLHEQLSRLRVVIEQNFVAVLNRLDEQDKNFRVMTNLISEQNYAKGNTALPAAGSQRNVGMRKKTVGPLGYRNMYRPIGPLMKRLRFSSTRHRPATTDNGNGVGTQGDSMVDIDAGRPTRSPAAIDGNVQIRDESATLLRGVLIGDAIPDPTGSIQDICGVESEQDSEQNPREMEQHSLMDAFDGLVLPEAQYVHGDGDEFDEYGLGSEVVSQQTSRTASEGASTSGTACVTVRSAIRMEDLDQALEVPGTSAAASAAGTRMGRAPGMRHQMNPVSTLRMEELELRTHAALDSLMSFQADMLKEGQRFETMADFLSCLQRYEQIAGIALTIYDSKKVETANRKVKPGSLSWDPKFKYT